MDSRDRSRYDGQSALIAFLMQHSRTTSGIVGSALFLVPLFAAAQSTPQNITQLYALALSLFNSAIPVLIGATAVVFLYGVVKYVAVGGDSGDRDEAIAYILYGLIGLFVMLSLWGLVGILTGTFNFGGAAGGGGVPVLPGGNGGLPPPPGGLPGNGG